MPADPITSETLTALLAGATPGPWEWLTKAGAREYYLHGGDACTGIKDDGATTADLDLAALATTLAAEVLALRAALEDAGVVKLEGGGYGCPRVGHEAEELRQGIQGLGGWRPNGEIDPDDIQRLLDDVDARDSLAYLEERDRAQAEIAALRARVAELEAVVAVLGVPDAR